MPIFVEQLKCFLCNKKVDEKDKSFIKFGRPTEWDQCRRCVKFYCECCKKSQLKPTQYICHYPKGTCEFCDFIEYEQELDLKTYVHLDNSKYYLLRRKSYMEEHVKIINSSLEKIEEKLKKGEVKRT